LEVLLGQTPRIFRFTGRDPVLGDFREPFTLHAYLYCLNDPVNSIDPSGEETLQSHLAAMGLGTYIWAAECTVVGTITAILVYEFFKEIGLHNLSLNLATYDQQSMDTALKMQKDIIVLSAWEGYLPGTGPPDSIAVRDNGDGTGTIRE
jgi:hypothetical protein